MGLDIGQITDSQSPYNANNMWAPSDNFYALLLEDSNADTGSGLDIINLKVTYSDDRLYTSMGFEKRNSSNPQFTDHCFTGEYPVNPIDANDKNF